MKTKDLCNNIYKDLAAELGQLSIQQQSINERIKEIVNQITILNAISPKFQEIEQDLINALNKEVR